ncbi:MAG: glutamate-5-semialdehyde dehydrogenase [Muribaculaceae bacterium]|jgi:glutamate-5-semialdehyde dehydrogenase|nr:glutamate-5-semialdehyde dehydrogenase [Muribaculaceae bacterium]
MTQLHDTFVQARQAARSLNRRSVEQVNSLLLALADAVENAIPQLLEANALDLARMDKSNPKYDRLQLTDQRLRDIAADMRSVAALPSPLGKILSSTTRPNGMTISKVSVPFGVIGIIYEARPNVTFDVFSLCTKSGSACLLKGGSDAHDTNTCAVALIKSVLVANGWDENTVTLLPASHEATAEMLNAVGMVDLIIPRGSKGLIDFVRDNSRVPVIETGAGVCHTYVHQSGLTDTARDIVFNAKTRRVSVCNALDTLVIDRSRLSDLRNICQPLADKGVTIYADPEAYEILNGAYPQLEQAQNSDFGREWLDYKMSVKTVENIDEAIQFIEANTSRHSECIVAQDQSAIDIFVNEVDAACVYANVSTAFTDGGQFGFGAEIGISTQKLHARGPMALPEITTYKYIVTGTGQTR